MTPFQELNGRRIRVDFSVTERPHNPTPGEYMGHRRGGDNYRGGRDSGRDRRDEYRERDRDYGRDHGRDRDRDRDPYGRDNRDWRDRRSPPPARGGGGRYSPEPRRRRSYSRSPVRGSDRDRRDYDTNGDRYDVTCIDSRSITDIFSGTLATRRQGPSCMTPPEWKSKK